MKKFTFTNPRFVKTAVKEGGYPVLRGDDGKALPEIAVAGRSNVGKSSLLNHLFQRKGLVKTSSTPGKTQALNFFTLNDELSLVDLPGYGYAKVPVPVRKKWGPMVQGYLDNREPLRLILFLFDIRRMPNEEDFRLLQWIVDRKKGMILVLTKVDKVSKNERVKRTDQILQAFGFEEVQVVHYSTAKNMGRKELIGMMREALAEEG